MLHASVHELDFLRGGSGERRKENPSQTVANGKTEALFERFDDDFRVGFRFVLHNLDFGHVHFDHVLPPYI